MVPQELNRSFDITVYSCVTFPNSQKLVNCPSSGTCTLEKLHKYKLLLSGIVPVVIHPNLVFLRVGIFLPKDILPSRSRSQKKLAPRSKSTSLGHSNPGSAKFKLSGILQCDTLKYCDGTSRVIVGTTRQEILQEKSLTCEEILN
nr:unnamed protein product [Callosobruchus chinensis]